MRSAKSYLAAHPSCFDEDPDCSCTGYRAEPETFHHAILHYPARARALNRLPKEVSDIGPDSLICTNFPVINALGN